MPSRDDRRVTMAWQPDPVMVCVPVRDEVALLPRFLDALAVQDRQAFTLCILFDGCTDQSAAVVAARVASLPFAILTVHAERGAPNAGRARRAAMAIALEAMPDDGGMIVSTDADSVPAPDWLSTNADGLTKADVVAGQIVRRGGDASPLQDRIEVYYDGLFALRRMIDPVPWEAPHVHHYTSGASLAFRTAAYRDLGGFEPLPSAEDARIVDRAHQMGLRVRRDAAVRVDTSARRVGRAVGGLADHLRRIDAGANQITMAHPADMVWRYRRQAAARAAWSQPGSLPALAADLGCSLRHVERAAAQAKNAEAFAMQLVPGIPGGERVVPLDIAEAAIRRLQTDWRKQAA